MQSKSFIKDTPKRPNVTLAVVRLIIPNFRTSIIGSSRLRIKEACFGHFGNIHVAKASRAIFIEEKISGLDISVEHFQVVEFFESTHSSYRDAPDLLFSELVVVLFELRDFLKKVSVVSEVHHDA